MTATCRSSSTPAPTAGTLLCREKAGNGRFLRCFYHAWTFDTPASSSPCPTRSAYGPGFDRDELSLAAPPRVESYRGFWFVSYDPDIVDLRTYLADAADDHRPVRRPGSETVGRRPRGARRHPRVRHAGQLEAAGGELLRRLPRHAHPPALHGDGAGLRRRPRERFAPQHGGGPVDGPRELGNGHGDRSAGRAGLGRDSATAAPTSSTTPVAPATASCSGRRRRPDERLPQPARSSPT